MRHAFALIALWGLTASSALAGTLTETEAAQLRADIASMVHNLETGDAKAFVERTHPSIQAIAGGKEAFVAATQQALDQVRQTGIRYLSSEVGEPTQTYAAGDEEVCFVPRVSVMEMGEKRARSTTFMIAIRRVGGSEWTYIDGAGLRKHPEMLYVLLPKLQREISLPPNVVERM